MTIRILIADDHPLVRQGLQAALAPVPEVEVVAEAATGQAAIREAVLHQPDVVVMDLQMPDLNGIDATRELARALPSAAVLVLTMFDDDDWGVARRGPARGYVLKGAEQQRSPGPSWPWPPERPSSAPRSPPGCWPTSPPHRPPRPRSRSSPPGNGRSWTCWRPASSNHQIADRLGLSGKTVTTISRPSSPSSRWPTDPGHPPGPQRRPRPPLTHHCRPSRSNSAGWHHRDAFKHRYAKVTRGRRRKRRPMSGSQLKLVVGPGWT